MQDSIIKGTGDSRYLKSVSDFLTKYPSYADFAAALIAGTLPVDFNGINTAGWQKTGTPLNKANLLSDATAAKFAADMPDTVNAALGLLGRFNAEMGNEYVWLRSDGKFVNAPNPSAYPPAVSDGYTYAAMGQAGKKLRSNIIKDITLSVDTSILEIDVSDIDWGKYFLVRVIVAVNNGSQLDMRINSTGGGGVDYVMFSWTTEGDRPGMIRQWWVENHPNALFPSTDIPYKDVKKIIFSGNKMYAGGKIQFIGMEE